MNTVKRAREILGIEIGELERVRRSLDKRFSRSVKIILESLKKGGKIVVTGVGKNFYVGQKISATKPVLALASDISIIASLVCSGRISQTDASWCITEAPWCWSHLLRASDMVDIILLYN